MAAHNSIGTQAATGVRAPDMSTAVYAEGLLAGLIGAATLALWFLIIDVIQGRPFYTPMVLGTALFRGAEAISANMPIDGEVVLTFTWVHVLAFLVIGCAASRLLAVAEGNPAAGFGIVLLFVVFEFGFLLVCAWFAEPVLKALAWPAVLVGNLMAAVAMAVVFKRRHPGLEILP
jgi:hypothetical protein